MSILLVDDRFRTMLDLRDILEGLGRGEVYSCSNIFQAIEKWGKYKDSLHHIITDLSMSPLGLSRDERKITSGGLYTGWVWLWNHVIKNSEGEVQEKIIKEKNIIIFSEYINNMEEYEFNSNEEKDVYFNIVNKISKSETDAQYLLVECIKKWSTYNYE